MILWFFSQFIFSKWFSYWIIINCYILRKSEISILYVLHCFFVFVRGTGEELPFIRVSSKPFYFKMVPLAHSGVVAHATAKSACTTSPGSFCFHHKGRCNVSWKESVLCLCESFKLPKKHTSCWKPLTYSPYPSNKGMPSVQALSWLPLSLWQWEKIWERAPK